MNKLLEFCNYIASLSGNQLDVPRAREIVKVINDFLYANYEGIGYTQALGRTYSYFSDFHKFWEQHHRDILECRINDVACESVADALHNVYLHTNGTAFSELYDKCGLTNQEVCKIRLLTANQDFRGSLNFKELSEVYKNDPSVFDLKDMATYPEKFLRDTKLINLSQTDKRSQYVKNIAQFYLSHNCEPYEILSKYDNDLIKFRHALINCAGAGFGNKKADMVIRDMIVMGIWKNYTGFDTIEVASDVNTMHVALRTGIITTAIPLVSSFLDIFCHQYAYIDDMNAMAWRRVWEIWRIKYPYESIESPCLLDYFIYNVVGKQFCKPSLYVYQCETEKHYFRWHSGMNRTCQICYKANKGRPVASPVERKLPCCDDEGYIAIMQTPYVKSLPNNQKINECPFSKLCKKRNLKSPKSISIEGRTGWVTAYTKIGEGGGGLMS